MADVPLPLGSRTIPVSQLPASNSNSSQWLNCSSPLTDLSPTNLVNSTVLNCTALTNWTELGRSSHIASELTHRKCCLQQLFCCVTSPCTWCVPLLHVYGPLPSNGSICYNIFIWYVVILLVTIGSATHHYSTYRCHFSRG
jgi:hypothetical protein